MSQTAAVTILSYSPASLDCDFEESFCDWEAHHGWVLRTRLEGFETSGKVLFFVNHNVVVCFTIVNEEEWLGSPANIKGANKDAKI